MGRETDKGRAIDPKSIKGLSGDRLLAVSDEHSADESMDPPLSAQKKDFSHRQMVQVKRSEKPAKLESKDASTESASNASNSVPEPLIKTVYTEKDLDFNFARNVAEGKERDKLKKDIQKASESENGK